jgi:hypothetical protein
LSENLQGTGFARNYFTSGLKKRQSYPDQQSLRYGNDITIKNASDISDGIRWNDHTDKEKMHETETYSLDDGEELGSRIAGLSVLDDSSMLKAPTSKWYALHHAVERGDKWNDHILAWGLNITASDMKAMKEKLTHLDVESGYATGPTTTIGSCSQALVMYQQMVDYKFDEWYDLFDILYNKLKPRFPEVSVPRFWRESAIAAFSLRCLSGPQDVSSGHGRRPHQTQVDGESKPSDGMNRTDLLLETVERTPWQGARLNFDCLDDIFAQSGLRIETMKAIARGLKFGESEVDCLITRRCCPLPLLAELVSDPQMLLGMMHDCDVVLSGTHAIKFFCPSVSSTDSIWEFKTHPHVLHWLKFAVYLVNIGVQWELPVSADGRLTEAERRLFNDEQFQYCPSPGQAIYGTLERGGKLHRIQLAAHAEYPHQQSSIQSILRSHSSISQCFISGFGAACMYSQSSTSGLSFVWSVRDYDNAQTFEDAQASVEELQRRGVKYCFSDLHMKRRPDLVPKPRKRELGDGGAICVPFERYVLKEKFGKAQLDFQLLKGITWLEGCHELEEICHEDGGFWDPSLEDRWAERTIMREEGLSDVSLFETMIQRLECPNCRLSERTICKSHAFPASESSLAELLFFCMEKIECRRMSWDFLQLPFCWREYWEYPYI